MQISDTEMTSDTTGHRAWLDGNRWRLSWLPDRELSRNQAITGVTFAEAVCQFEAAPQPKHSQHYLLMSSLAHELGVDLTDSIIEVRKECETARSGEGTGTVEGTLTRTVYPPQ